MERQFDLADYIHRKKQNEEMLSERSKGHVQNHEKFENLCTEIFNLFSAEWESSGRDLDMILERQKKAIIGYEREVRYFKVKIMDHLKALGAENYWYPEWHESLTDAIYHENWGLGCLAEWVAGTRKGLQHSSSAKIIGERIYFMIDGTLVLQPQKMNEERRRQLRRALLLKTPKRRPGNDYHELYMLNGIRITIYGDANTKPGQDTIVLRKFFVRDYSFKKQAELGTIPQKAEALFESMVRSGFNVAFTGAVRTAKTTFLTTWQSYEDPSLEGVSIETDPEIPFHEIMPRAPILQLVADGEALERIVKSIMRSDADYIILGEARDGVALNTALKIASKGTRRVKMTYHISDPLDFCYDISDEIVKTYGGSLFSTMIKAAKSFQFVFHFIQLRDKSQKRLAGIYEIIVMPDTHDIVFHRICRYRIRTDDWVWDGSLTDQTLEIAASEDVNQIEVLTDELARLSEEAQDTHESWFRPPTRHLRGGTE